MVDRRDILRGLAAGTMLTGLGAMGLPRIAMAAAPTERRLVVVILRGGLDGLSAVAPYGDDDYRRLRRSTAVPEPGAQGGAIDLDGRFGLHPAMEPLAELYRAGELLPVHAVGTGARTRSHFDAQDVLENGTSRPRGAYSGWLNRAIAAMHADERLGLAVGHQVPLLLRGDEPVRSWAPNVLPGAAADFLARIGEMYRGDPLFSAAFGEARASAELARDALGERGARSDMARRGMTPRPDRAFPAMAEATARFLRTADGPRIAALESTGWDTHVNQDFALGQALRGLSGGLINLKRELGPVWRQSMVVVVSEFGRTVAENGTRGTDHGTGGVALLAGGAVAGGRVAGAWPGLSDRDRYEGRDLMPTTDLRAVLKGILGRHLGIGQAVLDESVFPLSDRITALGGLVRG